MKYVTLADMALTIRANFHKVPHDIDFVAGVPRSGVLAASVIAEFLNAPLIDIDSFVFGAAPTGGRRMRSHRGTGLAKPRVLVVDDTIFHGTSMMAAKEKLAPLADRYSFAYLAVYLEGPCSDVDIWLEDLRPYTANFASFVLYEWNIIHHIPRVMDACLYDIDGVLCVNPPDERSGQPYVDHIKGAAPLFTPSVRIGGLVSYRLAKYEDITRRWLDAHGITYGNLTLFPADSWEARARTGISPAEFKAEVYRASTSAKLFVESDDSQARTIFSLVAKPVYCVESNTMYS